MILWNPHLNKPFFPGTSDSQESSCNARDLGVNPGSGREWQPTPVFLPGEFHGQRSLAIVHGGCKEPNMTELWTHRHTHTHTHTHTHKFSPIALIPLKVLQSFLFHLAWGADFLALKGLIRPGPFLTARPPAILSTSETHRALTPLTFFLFSDPLSPLLPQLLWVCSSPPFLVPLIQNPGAAT